MLFRTGKASAKASAKAGAKAGAIVTLNLADVPGSMYELCVELE